MLWRVLTGNNAKDHMDNVKSIASEHFDGFTIFASKGYWKGTEEESIVVEVISEDDILADINKMALAIKAANNQEAVLVQKIANESYFL